MIENNSDNLIIFKNQKSYNPFDLLEIVPESIFLTQTHIKVCEHIALLNGFSGNMKKVYINILVKHSQKAKIITALIFLSEKYGLESINATFLTKEIFENFLNTKEIYFKYQKFMPCKFINKSQYKKLIVKYFTHKLYRIFFFKKSSKNIVRSWVEISEEMYKNEYKNNTLVLIYPFYLNIKRHFKYIRYCKKNRYNFSLAGIPYSFVNLIKSIFKTKNDYFYVKFEHDGFLKHSEEIISLGVKKIYTSDEFEAGAYVMYKNLHQRNILSYNTAHGMSYGCPYLYYSSFQVYNKSQKKYYSFKSEYVNYIVRERKNINIDKNLIDLENKYNIAVVYLEANFKKLNMKYESNLELEIIKVLKDIKISHNQVDIYIKLHPNNLNGDTGNLNKLLSLEKIKAKKIFFLCYLSAAYYDYKHIGDFIFVEDDYVNTNTFYGENNLDSVKIDKLKEQILKRVCS